LGEKSEEPGTNGDLDLMQKSFPKCPICGQEGNYESTGVYSNFVKCRACKAKWKIRTKDKALKTLMLHELPKKGQALLNVYGINEPLFTVIGEHMDVSFWEKLKLSEKIDWQYFSSRVDPTISDLFVKKNKETVLHKWQGHHETLKAGSRHPIIIWRSGYLILTTQRILWIDRCFNGTWSIRISHKVGREIPLEHVKSISGESGDSVRWRNTESKPNDIVIVDNSGENVFTLGYAFIELIKDMTETAISSRCEEIEAEKKKERMHLAIDVSSLKSILDKGGVELQTLDCPECGAAIAFPKNGNHSTCAHCGKPT
jgi:hypothetical protein